jgi:hypothetical protein
VRPQYILLQVLDVIARDADVREFAEACCYTIDRFPFIDPLLYELARVVDLLDCGGIDTDISDLAARDLADLFDRKRITVQE